jgi:hypothetical protein
MSRVLKKKINVDSSSKVPQDKAVKLGDAINQIVESYITPRQRKFEVVSGLWKQLLPAELSQHSKIVDISAGQMKVLVSSPIYMYELRICSSEVIDEISSLCPQVRIKNIKFAIG